MENNSSGPNLPTLFIILSALVGIIIAGGVVLTLADKDATAFYGFATATLATVAAFGGLSRQTGKMANTVEEVKHNVNGRLSTLIDIATQNATSRKELKTVNQIGIDSGVIPVQDDTDLV